MADRYLEDFTVGEVFKAGGMTFTESMIVDFALMYDPQPFHIDVEAAKKSVFGGLSASGMFTLSMVFRMFYQEGLLRVCNMGARSFDEIELPRPVMAGDTVRSEVEVIEARASRSKPDRGLLRLRYRGYNQRDEMVISYVIPHIVRRRPEA